MPNEPIQKTQLKPVPDALALVDPAVPKIYANGFSVGMTNADAQIVLKLFGRPIAVLSFSYTLAKTLQNKLTVLVEQWEKRTSQTLQTTDMIDSHFGDIAPKE